MIAKNVIERRRKYLNLCTVFTSKTSFLSLLPCLNMSATTRFSILLALVFGQLFANTTTLSAKTPFTPNLEAAFSCNLPAPSNLVVTNVTTNSISVDWDDVPGAVGYYVIATDVQTGQTYYTNTTMASSEVVIGLPSGTYINVAVCAICNNGQYGSYSNVIEQTRIIIIDDLAGAYPSTNPPIVPCSGLFTIPSCFQLDQGPLMKTYFKVDYANSDGAIGVYHVNPDPYTQQGQVLYEQGWYFADDMRVPPFGNSQRYTQNVSVFYQPTTSPINFGYFLLSFNIKHHPGANSFGICYTPSNNIAIRPAASCSSDPKGNGSKPTPTQEPSATEALQAYPNPFKNVLEVALGEAGAQETRLDLIDVNGRLVRTETAGAGSQSVSIETRDLAPGVYVLRCQSAATTKTLKVIKQ